MAITPRAIDLAQPLTDSQIAQAKAAGIEAVCRYLWHGGKGLTAAEVAACARAGIKLVVIYEARGDVYASFTAAQGARDAATALTLAGLLGVHKGATIYFCGDDFDATNTQIREGIAAYVGAVAPLMRAAGYRVGVYGNGAMCAYMLDHGLADNAWVWGALGTNGTQAFIGSGRWSIRQYPTVREFGVSVDPDDVRGDYGGFIVETQDAPPPASSDIPDARTLQTKLAAEGLYHDAVDGIWGPHSQAALAAYLSRKGTR